MSRPLALAVLLLVSPALAGDRPERVSLEPREAAAATDAAFSPADHPVVTTLIITGAVASIALTVFAFVMASSARGGTPIPVGASGGGACIAPDGTVCK